MVYLFGKLKGKRKNVFEYGMSNKKEIDSLGKIPSNIRFIDSLTVFNTHVNPYKKYELTNNAVIITENKKQAPSVQIQQEILPEGLTEFKRD